MLLSPSYTLVIWPARRSLLEDACVVVSLALQHGITPAELAHSMGRAPAGETTTTPASVIGAVVEVLAEGFATKPHAEIEVPSALYEQSERVGP